MALALVGHSRLEVQVHRKLRCTLNTCFAEEYLNLFAREVTIFRTKYLQFRDKCLQTDFHGCHLQYTFLPPFHLSLVRQEPPTKL